MGALIRIVLLVAWSMGVGWLWRTGLLDGAAALAVAATGLAVLVLRRSRRRRRGLRYVQMAKQPLGVA